MRIKDYIPKFLTRQWKNWSKKVEKALVLFTPDYAKTSNHLFAPVIAVVAVIMTILLIGVAIGSFFSLFSSLLVLYFIFTKIFGIRLDASDVFVV